MYSVIVLLFAIQQPVPTDHPWEVRLKVVEARQKQIEVEGRQALREAEQYIRINDENIKNQRERIEGLNEKLKALESRLDGDVTDKVSEAKSAAEAVASKVDQAGKSSDLGRVLDWGGSALGVSAAALVGYFLRRLRQELIQHEALPSSVQPTVPLQSVTPPNPLGIRV